MVQANIKPFAVVTGASSGIGFELARQFVENNFDVLIAAEDNGIVSAAETLRRSGAVVMPVQVDLAREEGVETLWQAVKNMGRPLEAIAINAGVGVHGRFIETDFQEEKNMIALNVISTVHLAKLAAREMVRAGRGRILLTSSIAAVMPAPYMAVYAATKAFDLSLAEGLRNELRDTGVTVTALMPGATETNFFERAEMEDTKVGTQEKDDPADVARDGFRAMMEGKDHIVAHSLKTRLQGLVAEILPEPVKAQMHANLTRPGSADQH